jgi:hypothetical protein
MHVQVMGRYLCGRPHEQWQQYIDQEPADTRDDPIAAIHEIIRHSFLALPLPVKRCFLFFASLREDECIREVDLLDLWAGWELVPGPHAYRAAQSYLQKLEDAYLIHCMQIHLSPVACLSSSRKAENVFYMHHVLRDLACNVAQGRTSAIGTGSWGDVSRPVFVIEVGSLPMGSTCASPNAPLLPMLCAE